LQSVPILSEPVGGSRRVPEYPAILTASAPLVDQERSKAAERGFPGPGLKQCDAVAVNERMIGVGVVVVPPFVPAPVLPPWFVDPPMLFWLVEEPPTDR
jgi:hypothetical protein